MLDQDGAEPDDDREPEQVNELLLTRNRNGSGGRLKGRFDSAALFDQIAAVLDAKAAPLTADDRRPAGQRHAEAMAEVFGYVADHADTSIAAHHRWATPAPERADPVGRPGEPGPRRDARLRWAHDPRRVPDAVLRRVCDTTFVGLESEHGLGRQG